MRLLNYVIPFLVLLAAFFGLVDANHFLIFLESVILPGVKFGIDFWLSQLEIFPPSAFHF